MSVEAFPTSTYIIRGFRIFIANFLYFFSLYTFQVSYSYTIFIFWYFSFIFIQETHPRCYFCVTFCLFRMIKLGNYFLQYRFHPISTHPVLLMIDAIDPYRYRIACSLILKYNTNTNKIWFKTAHHFNWYVIYFRWMVVAKCWMWKYQTIKHHLVPQKVVPSLLLLPIPHRLQTSWLTLTAQTDPED